MAVPMDTLWPIEAHTAAKHQILRKYIDAWLPILSTYNQRVMYVDGFAGPGEYLRGEPGSPLIALDAALSHQATLAKELVFEFIEERKDRVEHLNACIAKLGLPPSVRVRVLQATFAATMMGFLDDADARHQQFPPTFVFIDPFGFSGIPYALIKRLLLKPRAEVLVNFMVDSINRFLAHPDMNITDHIVEAFGTRDALKIANGPARVDALKNLYHERLRLIAHFVRHFEIRDTDNRIQYYLFFASNNSLGHVRMKEAMWKVDPMGEFSFSDATDASQLLLFTSPTTTPLCDALVHKFQGRGQLPIKTVLEYVNDETAYIKRHMGEVLQELETQQRVTIAPLKQDGKKRRARSYPDNALITFEQE